MTSTENKEEISEKAKKTCVFWKNLKLRIENNLLCIAMILFIGILAWLVYKVNITNKFHDIKFSKLIIDSLVALGTLSLAIVTFRSNQMQKRAGRSNLSVEPSFVSADTFRDNSNPSCFSKANINPKYNFVVTNNGNDLAKIIKITVKYTFDFKKTNESEAQAEINILSHNQKTTFQIQTFSKLPQGILIKYNIVYQDEVTLEMCPPVIETLKIDIDSNNKTIIERNLPPFEDYSKMFDNPSIKVENDICLDDD